MEEYATIGILAFMALWLGVYCYIMRKVNRKLMTDVELQDNENMRLRKKLEDTEKFWQEEYRKSLEENSESRIRMFNNRRKVKIINPQLLDQSALDTKVERLMKEGYGLYVNGCVSGMLAFSKEEETKDQ